VIYCINPECQQRENPDDVEKCQYCGTPLLIRERYRLLNPLRPLKQNAFTEVFEIDDRGASKVMKVLRVDDDKLVELIEREARVLQRINHPGIPHCERDGYFLFSPNGSTEVHCLVLQKIEGQTLAQWLEEHERLAQPLALDWLKQLVVILDQVHQQGFFHRDIKPSNIILKPDGQLALIDFGAVRAISGTYLARISTGLTRTMRRNQDLTVVRTIGYAPPEQLNGKPLPQSDFFALGRTFSHLMSGVNLLDLPEDPDTNKLIWRDKAPQIDKPLAEFIDWLQNPAPGKRPQNTQIILQFLNDRLPRQLKIRRIRKSPLFKVGFITLCAFAALGAYKGATLYLSNYYFRQGAELENKEDFKGARNAYEKALGFNPKDDTISNNLAGVCYVLKDLPCAFRNYEKTLSDNRDSWEAYYNLGRIADDQGKSRLAENYYRESMRLGGTLAVGAMNNLARLKILEHSLPEAISLAQQGLQNTSDPKKQAVLLKNLGWVAFEMNNYKDAYSYLKASTDLNPEKPDAYCLLGKIYQARKESHKASQARQACVLLDSNLPEVRNWKLQILRYVETK